MDFLLTSRAHQELIFCQCNGSEPCNTCIKRSLSCSYGVENPNKEDEPSPLKRQKTNHSNSSSPTESNRLSLRDQKSTARELPLELEQEHASHQTQWSPTINQQSKQKQRPRSIDLSQIPSQRFDPVPPFGDGRHEVPIAELKAPEVKNPGHVSVSPEGVDDEAVLYNSTRMLQDPTGRLLYVGDSATLSFLQLIRMIVDNVIGPTPFTLDPRRHRIVEGTSSLPTNFRRTHLLPDRQTAQVLVDAYFTNVISHSMLDLLRTYANISID